MICCPSRSNSKPNVSPANTTNKRAVHCASPNLSSPQCYTSNVIFPLDHYYRPQRSWAKVMFLQVSVILSTGGGSASVHAGMPDHPPDQADTPPTRQTPPAPGPLHQAPAPGRHPPDQADPPGTRQAPPGPGRHPPPGSRRQHTVNERPVRILLECILVHFTVNVFSTFSLVFFRFP